MMGENRCKIVVRHSSKLRPAEFLVKEWRYPICAQVRNSSPEKFLKWNRTNRQILFRNKNEFHALVRKYMMAGFSFVIPGLWHRHSVKSLASKFLSVRVYLVSQLEKPNLKKNYYAGVRSDVSLSSESTVSLWSDGDPMEAEENHQAPHTLETHFCQVKYVLSDITRFFFHKNHVYNNVRA